MQHVNSYPANVENMVIAPNTASKWQMGFNSAFRRLMATSLNG
jgi:hypothetical protein